MKIRINHNRAFTLCGVIVGIFLIIMGVLVICLLRRCTQIQPRELPDDAVGELDERYPGWETNNNSRPWPTKFVPSALDISTPDPSSVVYEKVFLDNDFLVQISKDGSLTNWATVFHWIIGGSFGECDAQGVPWVYGFRTFKTNGISYTMNRDYSGFDIKVDPEVMATNRMMFWRSVK